MNDNLEKKSSGIWPNLISQLLSIIPSDLRDFIGFMAGMYILVSLPMLFVYGVKYVQKEANNPASTNSHCWQIKRVDNRIFKLNACTGETVDITHLEKKEAPNKQHSVAGNTIGKEQ